MIFYDNTCKTQGLEFKGHQTDPYEWPRSAKLHNAASGTSPTVGLSRLWLSSWQNLYDISIIIDIEIKII